MLKLRAVALVVVFGCSLATTHAQESQIIVSEGDTLHHTDFLQSDTLTQQPAGRRKSFLHRFVNYFERSTQDRTFDKRFDVTFAGGPSYSKHSSLGIGLLASGLYRVDMKDSVTQPSNVSVFANISISGFYAVGVTGNTIYDHNRQRTDYSLSFSSAPREFWGMGYKAGARNKASSYVEKNYLIEGRYLYGVMPHTFIGTILSFQHTAGKKFTNLDYLEGQRQSYTATGLGLVIEYDSRDFIPNPDRGIYLSLQQIIYAKGLGNCGKTLGRTTLTFNYYQKLWWGAILATDLYAEVNSDGTPWPMLARVGGSYRMRGYYLGQYMDNSTVSAQVELRQKIWRRIGAVAWGGAGNVFPDAKRYRWDQTLPNWGFGLRWELKKRINVRLDYGFGRNTSGFMLNINEAF